MAGWSREKICRLFATGQRKKLVFTATDFMLFDSNNLVYFEVLRPRNISYVFKVRPAKSFGGKFDFESRSVNLIAADPPDACFSVTNGPALHKFHIKRGIRESGLEGAFISIPLNVTNTPYLYTRQAPWSAW
ncbi:Protease-associated domain-containing protein 1 [Acropora cervicornis]|uniref:Protease-associated domain-containing protein 1 n=1 Tax=Acropora cervicornis TaxID=6130 RepID=A0AAD9VFC6_ACRCE|nr:Protease-associated domain-containing protein 1 [Acropora cervicornis]